MSKIRNNQRLFCGDERMKESLMTIDEIKAELDIREVDYDDCFSKSELVQRLAETRVTGKANPDIVDQFNDNLQQDNDFDFKNVDDELLDDAIAEDGSLPGGMSKEMMKALTSDADIMQMLKDPKMQDIMKAVMEGGPEAIKKYMSDPDAIMLLKSLSKTMGKFSQE